MPFDPASAARPISNDNPRSGAIPFYIEGIRALSLFPLIREVVVVRAANFYRHWRTR